MRRAAIALLFAVIGGGFIGAAPAFGGANARANVLFRWADSTGAALPSPVSSSGRPRMLVTASGLQNFRGADIQVLIFTCWQAPVPDAWLGNGTSGCNEGNWDFELGLPGSSYPNAFDGLPNLSILANSEMSVPPGTWYDNHPLMLLRLLAFGSGGVARDSLAEYGLWSIQFDLRGTQNGGPVDCVGDASHPIEANAIWLLPYQVIAPWAPSNFPMETGLRVALLDGSGNTDRVEPNFNDFFGPYALAWTTDPRGIRVCPTDGIKATTWGRLRKSYR